MDTKLYILTGNIVSRKAGYVTDIRYLEINKGSLNTWQKVRSLYGDDCIRDTPVPIPNTEVKPYNADGTARATVW